MVFSMATLTTLCTRPANNSSTAQEPCSLACLIRTLDESGDLFPFLQTHPASFISTFPFSTLSKTGPSFLSYTWSSVPNDLYWLLRPFPLFFASHLSQLSGIFFSSIFINLLDPPGRVSSRYLLLHFLPPPTNRQLQLIEATVLDPKHLIQRSYHD
jgi:hypothetical protein